MQSKAKGTRICALLATTDLFDVTDEMTLAGYSLVDRFYYREGISRR